MSDTATETPETETPETPTKNAPTLDDLGNLMLAKLQAQRTEYVDLFSKVEAATGDRDKAVHEMRESSEDTKVVKFREWSEKVMAEHERKVAEIHKYISENLLNAASMTEDEVKAAEETLKNLAGQFNQGVKYLDDNLYPGDETTASFSEAGFVEPLPGQRRKRAGGGTGTGGIKPRFGAVYVSPDNSKNSWTICDHEVTKGKNAGKRKSNLTDAAKVLKEKHDIKVSVPDLQTAYFAAAGIEPSEIDSAPDSVDFPVHVDGKTAYLLVTRAPSE